MSLGYAEKLSYRDDLGGQLGAPEIFDDSLNLNAKIQQLTEWVCFPWNDFFRCLEILEDIHDLNLMPKFCLSNRCKLATTSSASLEQASQQPVAFRILG